MGEISRVEIEKNVIIKLMGEDITKKDMASVDTRKFREAARAETEVLARWATDDGFEDDDTHYGLELEGCLVDGDSMPALMNEDFLNRFSDESVVPEIAKFNFEWNSPVYVRHPHMFQEMHQDLENFATKSRAIGDSMGIKPLWIGILPTLRDDLLNLDAMTVRNRYFELARRVMLLRKGQPVRLNIERFDSVSLVRDNIMTEAAATSLQIHTQVKQKDSVKAYNASLLLSGPCTALNANSPFLYGKKLWDETRIPVFEQSLALPKLADSEQAPVGFGAGYVQKSLVELFGENLENYQVILPVLFDDRLEKLRHLKFLNGQIWRWVRPIVGIEGKQPHLRIEQRCFGAGPSILDMMANTAFYIGLLHYFTHHAGPIEKVAAFSDCRENFYSCAQWGLKADVFWQGRKVNVQKLLHDELFDCAVSGLVELGFSEEDIDKYVNQVIKPRLRTGWNGAAWQKSFVDTHGSDFQELTKVYVENQESGKPVHLWKV
jgi:hypothetical protein